MIAVLRTFSAVIVALGFSNQVLSMSQDEPSSVPPSKPNITIILSDGSLVSIDPSEWGLDSNVLINKTDDRN